MSLVSVASRQQTGLLYAALGDSITVGYGISPFSSFVTIYSQWLRPRGIDRCINRGLNGLTSTQLLDMLQRDGELNNTIRQAAVITVTIGSNDLLQVVPTLLQGQQINVSLIINRLRLNMQQIACRIKQINPYAFVQVAGLYNPLLYSANTSYGRYCPFAQQVIGRANQVLAMTVRQAGYQFVAVEPWLSKIAGEGKPVMGRDQIHPGIYGHQALANAFENNYCYAMQGNAGQIIVHR